MQHVRQSHAIKSAYISKYIVIPTILMRNKIGYIYFDAVQSNHKPYAIQPVEAQANAVQNAFIKVVKDMQR